MSGFQFIHIETFAKIASRSNRKQSARNVAREAERDSGSCPHIENLMPFKLMYGITPSQAVDLAEKRASMGKDSQGRKLRKDAQILLGGVASYPIPISQLTPNDEGLKKWLKHNFNFLNQHCGSTLKSIIAHTDEKFFHIHWYQVPDIETISGRFNIGQVHPGILARDTVGGKQAKEKMRSYKQAMRDLQDSHYEQVGKPCGLAREGAKKRRLTRSEWKVEQATAERLASSLKLIDFAKDESLIIQDAKERLEVRDYKLKVLSESATRLVKKARFERDELINLKSKKISVVKYLKNKVEKLTEKIKTLLNKISFLERNNEKLNEDFSILKKQNLALSRINKNLTYQNDVKDRGLKHQKEEVFSIVNLIEKGKTKEVSEHYNYNNKRNTHHEFWT